MASCSAARPSDALLTSTGPASTPSRSVAPAPPTDCTPTLRLLLLLLLYYLTREDPASLPSLSWLSTVGPGLEEFLAPRCDICDMSDSWESWDPLVAVAGQRAQPAR